MKTNKTNNTLSATAVTTAMEATSKTVYNSIVDGVPAPKPIGNPEGTIDPMTGELIATSHMAYIEQARKQMLRTGKNYAVIEMPSDIGSIFKIEDGGYQRELSARKIEDIIRDFDENRVCLIVVNYRNGRFWITDGQHTAAVLQRLGIPTAWYKVMINESLEYEAKLFADQDKGSSRVSNNDKFFARLCAKEPAAMIIKEITSKYNVSIRKKVNSCCKSMEVGCIRTLDYIVNNFGKNGLDFVFQTIIELGWHKYDNGFSEPIMQLYAAYKYCAGNKKNYALLMTTLRAIDSPDNLIRKSEEKFKNALSHYNKKYVAKYITSIFEENK